MNDDKDYPIGTIFCEEATSVCGIIYAYRENLDKEHRYAVYWADGDFTLESYEHLTLDFEFISSPKEKNNKINLEFVNFFHQ